MMVPNSFPIFHLVLNRHLGLRISPQNLVSHTIYDLDAYPKLLAPTEFQQLSLRCVLQSFLLFLLSYTINACFPSCWKSSSVVPVFKNDGERSDPGKYRPDPGMFRPTSLLPIISKIFESFFNDSLTKHLDITGLFSDLQYGCRAFRSIADILTVLSERIYNSLDAGGETRAIALDISKAFDKVYHSGLLHKLKSYDVVGPILSILGILFAGTFIESCSCWPGSFISPMLEFLRDQFWDQPYSWFLLMILPMRFYQE